MENKKRSLNSENLKKIGKVILWSGISGAIVSAITILPDIDLPAKYVWAVPIINTILYTLKELFSGE